MKVRRATEFDAASISALIDHYVPSGTLLARSVDFVTTYCHEFIVATDDEDRVIGCVHLDEYSPSIAELRSLAVSPTAQGLGLGRALVEATIDLATKREYSILFAVSNDEAFFARFGFARMDIPELDRERSEVSRYKGVFAKELGVPSKGGRTG
ncbi:MAG TPA: GNAT family N-acetyltransferase [Gemmatimonadaceae bacterium]|nr:GNAT family N-acetyltransferase [Gemmatimonadaceae bacterium]